MQDVIMNKEQQDKLWNELSEEKQKSARELYKQITRPLNPAKSNAQNEADIMSFALENTFGSHNLNPKPKIRTWKDMKKEYMLRADIATSYIIDMDKRLYSEKLLLKTLATLQIAKLLELGYGGMVTEEEWKNENVNKYSIIPLDTLEGYRIVTHFFNGDKRFIAFHTNQQAEEFMSYPENRALVEHYFMM